MKGEISEPASEIKEKPKLKATKEAAEISEVPCDFCGKMFSSRGIGNHREACRKRKGSEQEAKISDKGSEIRSENEAKISDPASEKATEKASESKEKSEVSNDLSEGTARAKTASYKEISDPASEKEEPEGSIIYGALAAILAILAAAAGILYLWWKSKEGKTDAN